MLNLKDVWHLGRGLARPESVLATANGAIYASDSRYGVVRVGTDGEVAFAATLPEARSPIVPNGIALMSDGRFLLSNIGDTGGIYALDNGAVFKPYITEFEDRPAPPINFLMVDQKDRLWVSVSTMFSPRHRAYRHDVANGFIALIENGNFRLLADGLAYTNEIRLDPSGEWLYVSETFGKRISRFRVARDGALSDRSVFGTVDDGDFVDGIAFDEEGGLWAICIVSNRIYRFDRHGRRDLVLSETPVDFVRDVALALRDGKMGRRHFDETPNRVLKNVASIAFAGADRKTAVMGSLAGDTLIAFEAGVAGLEPVHWRSTPATLFDRPIDDHL